MKTLIYREGGEWNMNKKLLILLVLFLFKCESKSSSSNNLLTVSVLSYPVITTLEPRYVNPSFTINKVTYPASSLTITGRNFSAVPAENTVLFNGIPASVVSSTTTEIVANVPNGTYSGVITVAKSGGVCNSLDKKSGINCGGADLYVNCYLPFKSEYGSEILLNSSSQNSISFTESVGTKAFRVDLLGGTRQITLNCPNNMNVTMFSKTCSPTITNDVTPSSTIPQFSISGGYTLQFFVTTQKGNCTFTIL